jgi:hypothetical protein
MNEKAKPIETEAMVLSKREGMALMDPTNQTESGLKLLEERVRVAKQQTAILMRLISPSQVIVMDGGDGRETVYFTGGAADCILRKGFGMRFGEWTYEISRTADETTCVATADLMQQNGEVYERRKGFRALGGFVRNERDLIKGAVENAKHWAVTDILGLRFLSKADFKELGLDLDKLERRAEFQDHKSHGAAPGTTVAPFGKGIKGKPITDISDKDLEWLTGAVRSSVADPEKSKWKGKNETLLAALVEERARRDAPKNGDTSPPSDDDAPAHDPKTGEMKLCAYPDCEAESTRGVYCDDHPPKVGG